MSESSSSSKLSSSYVLRLGFFFLGGRPRGRPGPRGACPYEAAGGCVGRAGAAAGGRQGGGQRAAGRQVARCRQAGRQAGGAGAAAGGGRQRTLPLPLPLSFAWRE
jgi:hypothetical protein